MKKGLIHIYTGNGKGKTTSALGIGLRAYGNGLKVYMVQFLKSCITGELQGVKSFGNNFLIERLETSIKFIWELNEIELIDLKTKISKQFTEALEKAIVGKYDVFILDEILPAIKYNFISINSLKNFLNTKPDNMEIVMTGREAPEELIKISNYVSEVVEIKHPYAMGIQSRKGIEF